MTELKLTPLHGFHLRQGAHMVPFAGYEMPVHYEGILKEHLAVRQTAGLFDVSHMGEALVTGPAAAAYLDYLLPNRVAKLLPGKALYSTMCQEDGGVVDDVIVYCLSADQYMVVLNAANTDKDMAWMQQHQDGFNVNIADVSAQWALLALQGPLALDLLEKTFPGTRADALKRFTCKQVRLAANGFAADCLLSRTGYTGEDGVEIYCPADHADALANLLVDWGKPLGLALAGLGARDSLRLEAGLPLYGHEIDATISPLEAGLGWTVKLDKPGNFLGKRALVRQKTSGVPRRLIHFYLEDRRIARPDTPVSCGDIRVGTVVSGTQSPSLGKPIGSALIDASSDDAHLSVTVRGHTLPLIVKRPPLHRTGASGA